MNRADKARAVVMFEELAAALRAELLGEAALEHSQGSTPSWRMGDVTVAASLSNPSVSIVDQAAFLAYVEQYAPTEVEVITTKQIRPGYSKRLLAEMTERGEPLCDNDGIVVPGVRFNEGGTLRSVSVRPTSEFKDQAALFAAAVASGQRPLNLPGFGDEPLTIEAAPETPEVEAPVVEQAAPEWEQWPAQTTETPTSGFSDPWAGFDTAWAPGDEDREAT